MLLTLPPILTLSQSIFKYLLCPLDTSFLSLSKVQNCLLKIGRTKTLNAKLLGNIKGYLKHPLSVSVDKDDPLGTEVSHKSPDSLVIGMGAEAETTHLHINLVVFTWNIYDFLTLEDQIADRSGHAVARHDEFISWVAAPFSK